MFLDTKQASITNPTDGELCELSSLLGKLDGETRVVMEATGNYHLPIASFLYDSGFYVSVVNTMHIHDQMYFGVEPPFVRDVSWLPPFAPAVCAHPSIPGWERTDLMAAYVFQLMGNGFPTIDIAKERRLEYFNALEAYAARDDLVPFSEMIAELVEQRLDQYLALAEQA